ncbi:MAG: helix-turn-helix domain-containing protein [Clostridium perfringens]|nr:helix-turn-helix domain-containing protein [Clostridium perfringens]
MEQTIKLTTIDEIKTYSDPYRLKIITFLKNNREEATVKQIADFFEEVPSKVHYHIKKLERVGIVKLVRTEEIKGIVAKYYSLTAENFKIETQNIRSTTKEIYNSQISMVINDYYEKSKEKAIKSIEKSDEDDFNSISLNFDELYLTKEEFLVLNNELKNIISKYKEKKGASEKYHIFSICTIEDKIFN